MNIELGVLRSQIEEMTDFREMQEMYVTQLKARVDQLERERDRSVAVSRGSEKAQTNLKDTYV